MGCGTGRAFEPLLARGWRLVGCDLSPEMLAEARRKFGDRARLLVADARDLPLIPVTRGSTEEGAFDLVLLLNDVLNYAIEDEDLERVFAGLEKNLRPGEGLAIFDVNTLALFRADYASGATEETAGERSWEWRGLSSEVGPGQVYEAELSGSGVEPHRHRQRHWTIEQVKRALAASGLRCLAALGQREEGGRILLSEDPDEERDAKIVYVVSSAS